MRPSVTIGKSFIYAKAYLLSCNFASGSAEPRALEHQHHELLAAFIGRCMP